MKGSGRLGYTALHQAVSHNAPELIAPLVAAGADINLTTLATAKGTGGSETPLFMAVRNGYVEVARALLAAGADPSIPNIAGKTVFDIVPPFSAAKPNPKIVRANAGELGKLLANYGAQSLGADIELIPL